MSERQTGCSAAFSGRREGQRLPLPPYFQRGPNAWWGLEAGVPVLPALAEHRARPPSPPPASLRRTLTEADTGQREYQGTWFLFFYCWHQLGLYVASNVMH